MGFVSFNVDGKNTFVMQVAHSAGGQAPICVYDATQSTRLGRNGGRAARNTGALAGAHEIFCALSRRRANQTLA